jgi:hypothetical protein
MLPPSIVSRIHPQDSLADIRDVLAVRGKGALTSKTEVSRSLAETM